MGKIVNVPMFVYGTLRPGGYNDWHGAEEIVRNCTTNGRIYFVSEFGTGYPVAKLNEEGTIIGDVLLLDPHSDDYRAIVIMEEGAGYEMRQVSVTAPDGRIFDAQAWHYLFHPRGRHIASGDWLTEVRKARIL